MAAKFESISGSYDHKPMDSSEQASSKFSNPVSKPKDDGEHGSSKINAPKDSKDYTMGS